MVTGAPSVGKSPLVEKAERLLTAIKEVDFSHETTPCISTLVGIRDSLEEEGLLLRRKREGAIVLRNVVGGDLSLYVEAIAHEIIFGSEDFARECRRQIKILRPHIINNPEESIHVMKILG